MLLKKWSGKDIVALVFEGIGIFIIAVAKTFHLKLVLENFVSIFDNTFLLSFLPILDVTIFLLDK